MEFKYEADNQMRIHMERVLKGEYGLPFKLDYRTILDLGANIGAFTFWASQTYPLAKIYAYEPSPTNCAAFKKNLSNSAIPSYRYELIQAAVITSADPFITFYESSINCGMNSIISTMAGNIKDQYEVATLNPAKLPPADFIKVDTEGCEFDIISNYLLAGNSPSQISFEFHSIEDRIRLDALLREEYALTTGEIMFPQLGTYNYLHKRHFTRL